MNGIFTLRSQYDGLDISVLVTRPTSSPVAVLQLSHGMRGCKERFLPFMEYMSDHGVVCVANDHRGHGESVHAEKDRGYMYSGGYVALVEDMKMVTNWIHAAYPLVPVFILGHSMGSLAVRTYLKTHDDAVSGVFVCGSPSNNPAIPLVMVLMRILCLFNDGRLKPRMIQELTSWIYNRRFASEGKDAWTCSDAAIRKDFADNPSCTFDFTANALHALMSMMHETYSRKNWNVSHPDLPLYFISGADDPCMRSESAFHASVQLMAALGYSNVTSAIYPYMRHEVLNENGKEALWDDILEHIRLWS